MQEYLSDFKENETSENAGSVNWTDLAAAARCFPANEAYALHLVQTCLGYLPERHIILPELAFIQSLVNDLQTSSGTEDAFYDGLVFHTKKIRNEDMKQGGWIDKTQFDPADLELYDTYLSAFKQTARERLTEIMGYSPALIHSLEAELYLRRLCSHDGFYTALPWCHMDHKAVTVVRYREAWLLEGPAAADDSDLMGIHYQLQLLKYNSGEN